MAELTETLHEKDAEISSRDAELDELRKEMAKMEEELHKAAVLLRVKAEGNPHFTPEEHALIAELNSADEVRSNLHVAAGGRRRSMSSIGGAPVPEFAVGEKVFMLNPFFTDGTRLRISPEEKAEFNDQYILNDAEIEVLTLENGFAKVRETEASHQAEGQVNAEGWVRERNLSKLKRESGLFGLRKAILEGSSKNLLEGVEMSDVGSVEGSIAPSMAPSGVSEVTASEAATASEVVPQPGAHVESKADQAEYEKAMEMKRLEDRSTEIAQQLKTALEKTNLKTMELFRDWDSDNDGKISKKEFQLSMASLGLQATKDELAFVFDKCAACSPRPLTPSSRPAPSALPLLPRRPPAERRPPTPPFLTDGTLTSRRFSTSRRLTTPSAVSRRPRPSRSSRRPRTFRRRCASACRARRAWRPWGRSRVRLSPAPRQTPARRLPSQVTWRQVRARRPSWAAGGASRRRRRTRKSPRSTSGMPRSGCSRSRCTTWWRPASTCPLPARSSLLSSRSWSARSSPS